MMLRGQKKQAIMVKAELPEIDLSIEAGDWPEHDELERLIRAAIIAAIEVADLRYAKDAELSVLLTDDQAVQELNRQWRNIDKPTNVLSFPGEDIEVGQTAGMLLGDIAMGQQTLAKEALNEGKRFEDHFSHLVIHGFLHLFGYDHQDDEEAEIMEQFEREALAKLNIANPY